MSPHPPTLAAKRQRTNDVQLALVEPLARDLMRFLTGDPARPFHGRIIVRLVVQDDTIQVVQGRFRGEFKGAAVTAAALREAA